MFQSYFSKKFTKQYAKLPLSTRKKFDRQIQYLLQDLRHPSIHVMLRKNREKMFGREEWIDFTDLLSLFQKMSLSSEPLALMMRH